MNCRTTISRSRVAALVVLTLGLVVFSRQARAGKVDDVAKMLLEDSSYKVRLQAALVLGKLGDQAAVAPLAKALSDSNKGVRAIAAQSLGKLGSPAAAAALQGLMKTEQDPFVRSQAEKAIAMLGSSAGGGTGGGGAKGKIYLTFGTFAGGTRAADAATLEILRGALKRELGKMPAVAIEDMNSGKPGQTGFLIDGNVSRLDDAMSGGAMETNCDVKVMVARWPTKSIILWTNAGAAVQGGSRAQDKQVAHRDCLEASAGQVGEDLLKFFQSQGG